MEIGDRVQVVRDNPHGGREFGAAGDWLEIVRLPDRDRGFYRVKFVNQGAGQAGRDFNIRGEDIAPEEKTTIFMSVLMAPNGEVVCNKYSNRNALIDDEPMYRRADYIQLGRKEITISYSLASAIAQAAAAVPAAQPEPVAPVFGGRNNGGWEVFGGLVAPVMAAPEWNLPEVDQPEIEDEPILLDEEEDEEQEDEDHDFAAAEEWWNAEEPEPEEEH